jgi:hypothetical protein
MRVMIQLYVSNNDWSFVYSAPFSVNSVRPPIGVDRCGAVIAQNVLAPSFSADDNTGE